MVDWSAPPSEASNKRLLYDLTLGLLVATGPAMQLVANRTISLVWFGVGILITAIFYMSLFTASVQRFNDRADEVGTIGNVVFVIGMVAVIAGAIWLFTPPTFLLLSVVIGSCSVLVAAPALRLLKRVRSPERRHPA